MRHGGGVVGDGGEITPAVADLNEGKVRRSRVLGGLISEYKKAAQNPTTAGEKPQVKGYGRILEPYRAVLHNPWSRQWIAVRGRQAAITASTPQTLLHRLRVV
jgi:hypothetical protein